MVVLQILRLKLGSVSTIKCWGSSYKLEPAKICKTISLKPKMSKAQLVAFLELYWSYFILTYHFLVP